MLIKTIFAGFGGQGVLSLGLNLAQAAMMEGKFVTYLPAYGAEVRGGTANCTVVLSDEPVGSPIVDEPSALVALNLPSLDKFEPMVAKGGTILVNASLVDRDVKRHDVRVIRLDMNALATKVGSPRSLNMVALGGYVKATGAVPLEVVRQAMTRALESDGKGKSVAANVQGLEEGYNAVP
jgi:2-oxoglutarate ferredoxin oxidoreductase subunit gamma